jgi:serine/threonine-protein kinase HipA
MQEAQNLLAEIEADNAQIIRECPELSATMAGESRCLRAIVYIVLQEMTQQLR